MINFENLNLDIIKQKNVHNTIVVKNMARKTKIGKLLTI
ncbi:hypothetical protein J497_03100 [Acinetobacter baumannii 1121032]|nr:hypothetical protein J497_03100 [Acinetobacter baumannii 1121032]